MPRRLRKSVPKELLPNLQKLANVLQALRDAINLPIHITCGYRDPVRNAKVGGAPGSHHLFAAAADIQCPYLTPAELASKLIALHREFGLEVGEVGVYSKHLHVSVIGPFEVWLGKYKK